MSEIRFPIPVSAPAALARHRAAALALAVGVLLTFAVHSMMRRSEQREAQAVVENVARQRLEVLRENLGSSLEALHSLAALLTTRPDVSREEFRTFTSDTLARHPELQALSWSPKVAAGARVAIEAEMRARGFSDFVFRERSNATHALAPARERSDHYVVLLYIEPLERNLPVLGHTSKLQGGAILRSLESGGLAATSIAPLHHDGSNTPGIVVYLPLFEGPAPTTPVERRARHLGHVAAAFRLPNLVNASLARLPGLQVEIRDPRPDPRTVTYAVPCADDAPPHPTLAPCELPLVVADREFLVTFTPTTSFEPHAPPRAALLTLLGGLLLSMLASAYLATVARRNAEIARANAALQLEVAERRHAEEAAAAANRAKSEFVASLSHEIRTPLNSILGYAQILDRDASIQDAHREAVNAIAGSGRHLLGLLDSILDLSRIEAGRVELQRVAFDLPALFEGVAAMFRPRCAAKSLALRLDCRLPAGRGAVLGDEGKIRQVLINLANNAVKFTPHGEVVLALRPGDTADVWRFEVRDTGIGMAPAERANLFSRFHQTAAGRRFGGSGLGLAIARGLVEAMGGKLEVDSARGEGSRFSFSLRLSAAVLARMADPEQVIPRLAPGVSVRALVVDDDRDNRHILAHWLRDLGCAIAEAGTARDAREFARKDPPDVLFLDLFLTDTTGPELLATLRADGLPAETPVLLHTAALLSREQREQLQATGAELLQKPFRLEDLCACLCRVPGVRLVSAMAPRNPAVRTVVSRTWEPSELSELHVPEDLRERLIAAAEMHSTTVLKGGLQDLLQLGGAAGELATHLRGLLRSYDLSAIITLLRALRPVATMEPAAEAAPAGTPS